MYLTHAERAALYRQIEEIQDRPLITYVTSSRPQGEGTIASDLIPEFCRQHLAFPKDQKKIDLVIPVVVESRRIQSEFQSTVLIDAVRMPGLNINITITPMSKGWIADPEVHGGEEECIRD